MTTNDNKWTCKFCLKLFSPNYKYKTHLQRCLVYQHKVKMEYDILLELKDELKAELKPEIARILDNRATSTNEARRVHIFN